MPEIGISAGKTEKYTPSSVGFVDILGFSHLVQESESDEDAYSAVIDALSEIESQKVYISSSLAPEVKIINFSDTIVMWNSADIYSLWSVILMTAHLTARLLLRGILCRGAITVGGMYFESLSKNENTKESIFGPAIIDAYTLEKTVAKFPRIILSKQSFEMITKAAATTPIIAEFQSRHIERHIDGIPYLNIFQLAREMLCADDSETKMAGNAYCDELRRNLERRAFKYLYIPGAWSKYQWIAERFNDMVMELPGHAHKPKMIDIFAIPQLNSLNHLK